ncbi:MAG: transposase [Planctomycetia bacterium]|nr:transposase [Planctomycetia bacterium]
MLIANPCSGKTFYRKRRRRYHEPGEAHELTFSCYRRFQFLNSNRTRQWFVESLDEARREMRFDLWAYVIMPEHVHVVICPHDAKPDIGKMVSSIKEPVARKAIRFLAEHAPKWIERITVREGKRSRRRFWQPGGGYDRNVLEVATVHEMIAYIHANPVRRALVERQDQWEWSSARWYAGIRPAAIEMDATIPVLHAPRDGTPFAQVV